VLQVDAALPPLQPDGVRLLQCQRAERSTMGVLRQLFGPSREEVWQQLAAELGANYESGFWTGAKVSIEYGQWTITLDSYTVSTGKSHHHYTRFRAPYVNPDGFRFGIYRKNLFTPLAKWMGMQDIEVGHAEFDQAFVIQGNNDKQVKALFADDSIRKLIAVQPDVSFMVRGDQGWFSRIHPEGVDELYFQASGIIKDLPRLKELFALFGLVLDRLCDLGSAYESAGIATKQDGHP
jgi:hypothetical protein